MTKRGSCPKDEFTWCRISYAKVDVFSNLSPLPSATPSYDLPLSSLDDLNSQLTHPSLSHFHPPLQRLITESTQLSYICSAPSPNRNHCKTQTPSVPHSLNTSHLSVA